MEQIRNRILGRSRFIILLACLQTQLFAQQRIHPFQTVGTLQDYSSYWTRCLFQDSRDLIWIGTLGGLDLWDGTGIKSYVHTPFRQDGFPAQAIYAISEDQNGSLWLGERGGELLKYDPSLNNYTRIPIPPCPDQCIVSKLKFDTQGKLWIGTNQGLLLYTPETAEFTSIPCLTRQGDLVHRKLEISDMEWDTCGVLWVTSRNGLFHADPETSTLKPHFFEIPNFDNDTIGSFMCLSRGSDGMFWILQGSGVLVKFEPRTERLTFVGPPDFDQNIGPRGERSGTGGVEVTRDGKVLFGCYGELWAYDPRTGAIESLDLPPGLAVNDIMQERNGAVFISTDRGVMNLDPKALLLKRITPDQIPIQKGFITHCLINGSLIWIGTSESGLFRMQLETGELRQYHQSGTRGELPSAVIKRILKDREGKIWVMTSGGLLLYEPDRDRFRSFDIYNHHYICADREGFFWISGKDNLLKFDPVSFRSERFQLNIPLPMDGNAVLFGMIRDDSGILWLGENGGPGLVSVDAAKGEWSCHNYRIDRPDGIPSDAILSILYDSGKNIWVGTDNGLCCLTTFPDADSISCANYFEKDGLVNRQISSLLEDQSGNIWAGTLKGISILRKDRGISNLTSADGLSEAIPAILSLNLDSAGNVFAGGKDITIIPPAFLSELPGPPPVMITDLQLFGTSVVPGEKSPLKESIDQTNHIELSHNQNFIRFEFASLNYIHPEKNRYRYFMEGIDGDTVEALAQNTAVYTRVPPGRYNFWVTGSNASGVWNHAGRSVQIVIHPPWYQTQAAIFIYIASVLLLIYGYIQYRLYRIKKERTHLEQQVSFRTMELKEKNEQILAMEQMKNRLFNSLIQEIRTPLSLIEGPLEQLQKQEKYNREEKGWFEMIQRNNQRMIQRFDQLQDIAELDAGQMKMVMERSSPLLSIKNTIREFHSVAVSRGIRLIMDVVENGEAHYHDPDKISKIITQLLSNAFKFTHPGGIVTARIKIIPERKDPARKNLRILIADTGPGIPVDEREKIFDRFYTYGQAIPGEASGTGIGLTLTRELIHLMHGEITIKSLEGAGAIFIVTIPLGLDHYGTQEYVLKGGFREKPDIQDDPADGVDGTGSAATGNGMDQILLIDDDKDLRTYINDSISEYYEVLEAADGRSGWLLAQEVIPDLIVTDILMPEMDGRELCRKLKNNHPTSHIPVILLTARTAVKERIEGLEMGADAYLCKPFRIEELKVRIRNLLGQRDLLRRKYSTYVDIGLEGMQVTSLDDQFLKKLTSLIEHHLSDPQLDVALLMDKMAMSRSSLFRKLKALTGESPITLIRKMRLNRAAALIRNEEGSITQILMEVGFSNPSYFARCFREQFGKTPSEYKYGNSSGHSPQKV